MTDHYVYNNPYMKIFIGADHRGFALKEGLKTSLRQDGHAVVDCGNTHFNQDDDFVDFSIEVAKRILAEPGTRGILLCGSGAGVCIAANRFRGVRCGIGLSPKQVDDMVRDDAVNILAIAANETDELGAELLVRAFLQTNPSSEERYVRRITKLDTLPQ